MSIACDPWKYYNCAYFGSCLYCNMSLHFIVMYVALLLQHDIICLKFVDNSNFISLYLSKKYKGEKIKFSTTQPYQYQDNNISQQLSYSPTFLEKLAVLICFSWYSIHNGKYFKGIIFCLIRRYQPIWFFLHILQQKSGIFYSILV